MAMGFGSDLVVIVQELAGGDIVLVRFFMEGGDVGKDGSFVLNVEKIG